MLLAALFLTTGVKAQTVPGDKWRFGIGADGLLPVGNLSNTANFGLGLTPRVQYSLNNKVAFTFTTGIYHFFTKTIYIPDGEFGAGSTIENKLDLIPAKAGLKYFLPSNFYIAGELGFAFEVGNGGGPTKFVASPSVGYVTKNWDIGFRYENFSGDGYSYGVLGLRVAYGFKL